MRRLAPIVAAALLAVGCAGARLPWQRRPAPEPPATPDAALARADELASRRPVEARKLYRQVLRESQSEATASEALWGLARLRLDPDSPLKDYHLAGVALSLLRSRYPNSRRATEAGVWQSVLTELDRCKGEASRLQDDLDRLKKSDIELEGEP